MENNIQNLCDLQSLSRYELVSKEFLLEKYFRIVNIEDLLNEDKYEDKYNEVV